jgi:ABC-type transport system substrate-binding protein
MSGPVARRTHEVLSMGMRTGRAIGLLGAVALLVGACGTTPAPTPAPAPSQAAPSDFRFAIAGEPTSFSPAAQDAATAWVNRLLYTGLYRVDNTGDVVPDLAAAMPAVGADGRTLTITLRSDARWHDGSPVTSADAKFTFDLAMSPACSFNPTTCSTWGDNVQSVTAPSPTSLVVTLKKKYAPIYYYGLTQLVVPKAATEASYARFVAGLGAVDAAAVTALADRIATARRADACSGAAPPDTCSPSFYGADVEAILASAGLAPPAKAGFVGADGQTDAAAYSLALLGRLTDLGAALGAAKADRLAAAYRLLDINRNPVGSGAYSFVKYTPGQSVELARFDDYYRFKPGPAGVVVRVMRDATSASEALQTGAVDWRTEITPDEVSALRANPDIRLSDYPELAYTYIAFNVRQGRVFADPAARRAFATCIDHASSVKSATGGTAVPVAANVPPGSFFFDPSIPDYTFDVAGAKTLLESSGYSLTDGVYQKAGKKLQADLLVRRDRPEQVKFAQLAREQVARCGIDITVRESDYATDIVPVLSYPNDFDLYLGISDILPDPVDGDVFACTHVTTKKNRSDANVTGYCDPKFDKLETAALQEMDRARRKELMGQVQLKLHDAGPYYFLWADLGHRAYRTGVATNGELGPIDYTSIYDWWNIDSWIVNR